MTAVSPGQTGPRLEAGLSRILAVLCVTQITSWGILYYAFPVLAGHITAGTGWSPSLVTAAFSAGLVVSALAGVPVGRWIDRRGPREIMSLGSVLGVLGVVAIALAPNLAVFTVAWLVTGVAMAAVLYAPAFAALTRWYGPRRLQALTVVTLVAGLASTVFAPLTAALSDRLDWRSTYLVLACLLAVITIPAHWWGLRRAWPPAETSVTAEVPGRVVRSRAFVALIVAFTLAACAEYAGLVNFVALLRERGLSVGTAAIALGLSGAGQVLGRLGYSRLSQRVGVRGRTVLVLTALALTTGVLGVLTSVWVLVAAGVLAGTVRGIFTLLQATAVTERWGATHYGHLSAILSAPVTFAAALAPWIGAALADVLGGYPAMFLLMGALGLAAAVIAIASVPARPNQHRAGVSTDADPGELLASNER